MLVSVCTPTDNLAFLPEAYHSLEAQTHKDWEWVLVPNGALTYEQLEAELPQAVGDRRVKIVGDLGGVKLDRVGALKMLAFKAAHGEILVEFDHDDVLLPKALEKVAAAFKDSEVVFVYSNCA